MKRLIILALLGIGIAFQGCEDPTALKAIQYTKNGDVFTTTDTYDTPCEDGFLYKVYNKGAIPLFNNDGTAIHCTHTTINKESK